MMTNFKLSRKLTSKNRWQTGGAIFILILSLLLFGCLMDGLSNIGVSYRLSKDFFSRNGIYCDNIQMDKILESIDIEDVEAFETMKGAVIHTKSGARNYYAYSYTSILSDELRVPLDKGEWFAGAAKREGYLNAVVSANAGLDIGEELVLYDSSKNEYKFYITGILPQKTLAPYSSSKASPITTEDFLGQYDESVEEYNPFIMVEDNEALDFRLLETYVILKDNVNSAQRDIYLEKISNVAGFSSLVISFEEILNNTETENKNTLEAFLPLTIIFGLLSILSLVVITLLSIDKNKDVLISYYLVGARKRDIYSILFLYYLRIYLVASIIYGLLYVVIDIIGFNPFYLNGIFYSNTVGVALVPIGYFVVTLITAVIFSRREIQNLLNKCILEN